MREVIRRQMEESLRDGWRPGLSWAEWDLYELDDKKEVKRVEKDLDGAMKKAQRRIIAFMRENPEYSDKVAGPYAQSVYKKTVEPVLKKYKKYGAFDTSPKYVAIQGLVNIVKDYYGIKRWTKLGDYIG